MKIEFIFLSCAQTVLYIRNSAAQRSQRRKKQAAAGKRCPVLEKKANKILLGACGGITGAVNGIFGGGGGMIVVPLLTSLANKPPLVAHATAILVILPVSLASSIVYLIGGQFDTELFLSVTLGVLAGGFAGAKSLGAITPAAATLVFAAVMLAAGVWMVI